MNNSPKVGDKYDRNRFEVHSRVKGSTGPWYAYIRGAETMEDVKRRFAERLKLDRAGEEATSWLIGRGPKFEYRIAKVIATVEIMEIIP